jgi:hypothetical protein
VTDDPIDRAVIALLEARSLGLTRAQRHRMLPPRPVQGHTGEVERGLRRMAAAAAREKKLREREAVRRTELLRAKALLS